VGSASSGKLSDFVIYHGHRNLEWTYFKNMPSSLLWLYLPLHILMDVYFLLSFLLKGKTSAIFTAKLNALRGIPAALAKRRSIQKSRSVSATEIHRTMVKGIFSPYRASRQRRV
jgi:hypothetical protein